MEWNLHFSLSNWQAGLRTMIGGRAIEVFYTIISEQGTSGHACNISDIVSSSGLSRSTVYKTLKKLASSNIIQIDQSSDDKREFLITFS